MHVDVTKRLGVMLYARLVPCKQVLDIQNVHILKAPRGF